MSYSSSLSPKLLSEALSIAWARASSWYLREIQMLVPPRILAWLLDRGDRQLVFRPGDKSLTFRAVGSLEQAPIPTDELIASSLSEALAQRNLKRDAVNIVLEIEPSAFLVRRFDLPKLALAELPKLLAADIERKTPFRLADVLYGHVWSTHPVSPEKARVELWILRRDIVSKAIEGSFFEWDDIAFVRPSGDRETPNAPVIELRRRTEAVDWFRHLAVGSILATILLLLVGAGVTFSRQHRSGADLETKIVEASARAARVRQVADSAKGESHLLSTLRHERANWPPFADLWEEASRLLPDTAYVTELRVTEGNASERSLEITGLAESAVGLPALFEKSPIFSEAALTAPITSDTQEKREAFSMRARIRPKGAAK